MIRAGHRSRAYAVVSVSEQEYVVAGVGGFNGDGKSDILWRNIRNGRNTIWKSADRSTEQAVDFVSDLNYVVAGVGDFNGDGKSDILWRNIQTGRKNIWKSGGRDTKQEQGSVENRRGKQDEDG